jgi:hypothetical protein
MTCQPQLAGAFQRPLGRFLRYCSLAATSAVLALLAFSLLASLISAISGGLAFPDALIWSFVSLVPVFVLLAVATVVPGMVTFVFVIRTMRDRNVPSIWAVSCGAMGASLTAWFFALSVWFYLVGSAFSLGPWVLKDFLLVTLPCVSLHMLAAVIMTRIVYR